MATTHFFDYDDRYFQDTRHTREELYELQSTIMSVESSSDIAANIRRLNKFEEKEIQVALNQYFDQGKIDRVGASMSSKQGIYTGHSTAGKPTIYRYHTKNSF